MELILPDQIALDATSKECISDVVETARRVNEFRPLPADVVRRIQDELLPERVHHSNAIEGNTLDFRETKMILDTGKLIPSKPREAYEARNLGEAARSLSEVATDDMSIHTRERLLEIHGLILRDIDDDRAGRFRDHGVTITGAAWKPPRHEVVPTLVDRVLARLAVAGDETPLLMGVWAHWAIAAIHPFSDGNGRTARLWQDLVFYQRGLTCAVIQQHERREYFDSIQAADDGCFDPLLQFIGTRVLKTFDRYLTELGKAEEADAWVDEVAGEADARAVQSRQRKYMVWTRTMERLRFEFTVYAGKISERSQEVSVQVRDYPLMVQEAWENLLRGMRVERTWFFVADFRRGPVFRRYCFFFGRHFGSEIDTPEEANSGACLLVSEYDTSNQRYARLDDVGVCPIAVREIFIVDGRFVRRRIDFNRNEPVYDRDVDPGAIARDFIKDVILNRLT